MKKILLALIASATAFGGISAARAADDVGPYAGVGLVSSTHKYNLSNDTSNGDRSSTEWSGKIYGGYQLNKNFAVEGGYTDFGSSDYNYSVGTASGHIDSKSHALYLAGKGSVPINEQFSVFGKLGVAYNKNEVHGTGLATPYVTGDSNRTNLYASVGGEYAINQKVSVSLEYEHYGKNGIEQGRRNGTVTLGARYNF